MNKTDTFRLRFALAAVLAAVWTAAGSLQAARVGNGLLALYTFQEGQGNTAQDVSGEGAALDLLIADADRVQWLAEGGLAVVSNTRISSLHPAAKIITACVSNNAVTIEAWVTPTNALQTGPARIVTLSSDDDNRNFTLGQQGSLYDVRLRTTGTDANGSPGTATGAGYAVNALTHVVFAREPGGNARIYVNGNEVAFQPAPGSLENWDPNYRFGLGNEIETEQPWLGELHLVAVYGRALTAAEVEQNFNHGAHGPSMQPPAITAHPQDVTVQEPDPAAFEVAAVGDPPLFYQWRRDFTNLANETQATFTLSHTDWDADDGAQFDVVVSNVYGSVTSEVATLTVHAAPPAITAEPTNATVREPSPVSFSVAATGRGAITYLWRRGGVEQGAETNATLTLASTDQGVDDGAHFDVLVSNPYGTTTSQTAVLTVLPPALPPTVTQNPTNATVTEPEQAVFSVAAAGEEPIVYQWRRDGTNLGGSTHTTLIVSPTDWALDNGAQFDVVVSNQHGAVTSAVATLTVNPQPPSIQQSPTNRTVVAPNGTTFQVAAGGREPLAYQWWRDGGELAGETNAIYTLESTVKAADDGAGFRVAVSSPYGVATSAVAVLTVVQAPSVVAHPQNLLVVEPAPATFEVTASGDAPLSYRWWRDGGELAGETNANYTLGSTDKAADDGAGFRVVVSNPYGVATSAVAMLTVVQAPRITTQPVDAEVLEPDPALFQVAATGSVPLYYEWRRDGVALDGETNAVHETGVTSAASDDGAEFIVVVSNAYGAVTSDVARLTVNSGMPVITASPKNALAVEPAGATFTVTADGRQPLAYQWRRDGLELGGETNAAYMLAVTDKALDDGAGFRVVVSNPYGVATSAVAVLTVVQAPSVVAHPQNLLVVEPAPATFEVTASGDAPLSYRWWRDGGELAGETNANYTLGSTDKAADDGAGFRVVVSNPYGVATSAVAMLTVVQAPRITAQPIDAEVFEPDPGLFQVAATGSVPLYYEWRRDGVALEGETNSVHETGATSAASDDGAEFIVVVSNAYGAVTSDVARLTVNSGMPVITASPKNALAVEPAGAAFTVTADGRQPLAYQWRRDGLELGGETNAAYMLAVTDKALDDGAEFIVVVSNSLGAVTSDVAVLTVVLAPAIAAQPADRTVLEPSGASFDVEASGDAPLSYQWRRDGFEIPGETNTSYTLASTSALLDDGAQFDVVVSNPYGEAISRSALLTVGADSPQPPPPGETNAVTYPADFAGKWVYFTVWDATDAVWVGGQDLNSPTVLTFLDMQNGHWYWIGVWDYSVGSWAFGEWYMRLE